MTLNGLDIRSHRFFDDLEDEHLALLRRIARWERYSNGELLFDQGDPASAAYFLFSGEVEVRTQGPGGNELLLAKLGPGEVLGELSLIHQHRRSAGAVARGDLTVMAIERSDLAALCAHYHPISLHILHRLAQLLACRIHRSHSSHVGSVLARPRKRNLPSEITADCEGAPFNVRPFLPQLAFFRQFTDRDIDGFVDLCTLWTLPRSHVITSPVDGKRSCFVVVRGAVEAIVQRDSGSYRTAVLGPGTLFGELAWLLQKPSGSEIHSLESCTLLELSTEKLWGLLDPNRHLSFRFHESLVRSLMTTLSTQTRALARTQQRQLAHVEVWSTGT